MAMQIQNQNTIGLQCRFLTAGDSSQLFLLFLYGNIFFSFSICLVKKQFSVLKHCAVRKFNSPICLPVNPNNSFLNAHLSQIANQVLTGQATCCNTYIYVLKKPIYSLVKDGLAFETLISYKIL